MINSEESFRSVALCVNNLFSGTVYTAAAASADQAERLVQNATTEAEHTSAQALAAAERTIARNKVS